MEVKKYTEDQFNFIKKTILNKRKRPVNITDKRVREIYRRNFSGDRKDYTYTKMINRLLDDICPYKFAGYWADTEKFSTYVRNIDDKTDYFWASRYRQLPNNKKITISRYYYKANSFTVLHVSDKHIATLLSIAYPEKFAPIHEEFIVEEYESDFVYDPR